MFMDDVAYESILVERTDLAGCVTSLKAIDMLRAQAKHQHGYFKRADPSIGDHGLWTGPPTILLAVKTANSLEKGKSCWKKAATQYLCSTLIKDGAVVLSFYLSCR